MTTDRNRVCPVELANSLDSRIRRWLQNPEKLLAPYVKRGMSTLDVGCGPGFFSVALADLVGPSGRVIAADLQDGMLDRLRKKIRGTILEERIQLVKCDQDSINVASKVDFALAFYIVHEVPKKESFFRQLKSVLTETGQLLIVEPKLFHVSRKDFQITLQIAELVGFKASPGPRQPFSWSALLFISE
jgi:ubiquinone/menaquinone biosynthesis C-methylase UbiE